MLLSNKEILEAIQQGNIVISPFDERQLQTNSYDMRLGEHYYLGDSSMPFVDYGDPDSLRKYWGDLRRASQGIIEIPPCGIILAHTAEIAGGKNGYTTKMFTRSTCGRSGIDAVCGSSGVGDAGFINVWTLEIVNHLSVPMRLRPGMRICQIVFYYIGATLNEYQGKYGQDVWQPYDMLPKARKDWDFEVYSKGNDSSAVEVPGR